MQSQSHQEEAQEEGRAFSNKELIQRYNSLQGAKPHFTVPKIKLAFNRNMTRIKSALEPFNEFDKDLRGRYDLSPGTPLYDEDGSPSEGVPSELYSDRDEALQEDAESYEPYRVPERLLDNEPGQMADGRTGLPDNALALVLWMFEE